MNSKKDYKNLPFYIYGLYDPISLKVRYIGFTHRELKIRLCEHISYSRSKKTHKDKWIQKLLENNLCPDIKIIEVTDFYHREDREKYWISFFGRENLTNGTDGGEGNLGNKNFLGRKHSPESLLKMSKSQKGRIVSEETRNRLSEINKGRQGTFKGKKHTEETKIKLSNAKKGKIPYNKGVPMSEDQKLKLSISKKEKMTDEKKSNISKGLLGKESKNKNKKLNIIRSSSYAGVYWHSQSNRWRSRIVVNNIRIHLAQVESEILAAQIFDLNLLKFYPDNIEKLNFSSLLSIYKSLLFEGVDKLKNEILL